MSYYFQNARILMGDYEALPLQNAVVLVQDGRIAYAGYAEQAPEVPEDAEVIDEIPMAYKDIDAVMAAQSDLVEVIYTLRQVVCVKG